MATETGRALRWEVAVATLVLTVWACGQGSDPDDQGDAAPTPSLRSPSTEDVSETRAVTPVGSGACEEPAREVSLGSPITSEISAVAQPPPERKYFCVLIPDEVGGIMFELTGATSDLNLFVGYPDLETVQQGGMWFWPSEERGVQDRVVVVEPALADYVNPGPYYIEVSPEDFRTSSPFTLSVRIQ